MTLQDQKSALISYLKMKTEQSDWHGVSDAANDLRELEVAIRLSPVTRIEQAPIKRRQKPQAVKVATENAVNTAIQNNIVQTNPAEVEPTQLEIPHNVGKVASLLRMGDAELLDNLFPLPKGVEA